MVALPMTLELALRHEGYTIDLQQAVASTITTDLGIIEVPAQILSVLTWRRTEYQSATPTTPELGADLFINSLPLFDEVYRPILLSNILDHFRTRRLAYDTPGQFRLAVRRWGNLNMRLFNQRYASTAVLMPLDDTALTSHGLDVSSDFPQSQISGSADYATASTDRRGADNGRHRSIASLLIEQRAAYLNVDAEIVDAMEPLFLGIYDRGELGAPDQSAPRMGLPGFYNRPGNFDGYPDYYC